MTKNKCPKCGSAQTYLYEDGMACFCGYHSYKGEIVSQEIAEAEVSGNRKKPWGQRGFSQAARELKRRGLPVQTGVKVDQIVDLPKPLTMLLDYLHEIVVVMERGEREDWLALFGEAIDRLYPVMTTSPK